MIDKGKRLAAHLLEAAEADIEFADGRFTVAGTDRGMTLKQVARAAFQPARLPPGMEPGFYEHATYAPKRDTFPERLPCLRGGDRSGHRRGRRCSPISWSTTSAR